MNGRNYKHGFTIVEILIVVVVIAIIAGLATVSFGNVTQSARNSQTFTAIKEYKDALTLYARDNNAYPTTSSAGSTPVCIGSNYAGGQCWNGAYSEDAGLMGAMSDAYGDKLGNVGSRSSSSYGAIYIPISAGETLNGEVRDWIVYEIQGKDARCAVGPIATWVGSGAYTNQAPGSGRTSTLANGSGECRVILPKPN